MSSSVSRPLSGKVALVTCSTNGIGYAVAEALAQAGAELLLCSRDIENGSLKRVQDTLSSVSNKNVSGIRCDLSTAEGCDQLLKFVHTFQQDRPIDIFVYNSPHPHSPEALLPISCEQLDRATEACIKTPLRLCQSVVPVMAKNRWGRVFLLSSCYAVKPTTKFYLSSFLRSALNNLAKLLAQEFSTAGVVANTLLLGYFDTALTRGLPKDNVSIKIAGGLQADGQLPNPSSLACFIADLCVRETSLINGAEILLDSGYLTQVDSTTLPY